MTGIDIKKGAKGITTGGNITLWSHTFYIGEGEKPLPPTKADCILSKYRWDIGDGKTVEWKNALEGKIYRSKISNDDYDILLRLAGMPK